MEFERKGMSKRLHEHVFLAALVGGILGAKFLFLIENVPISDHSFPPQALSASKGWSYFLRRAFSGSLCLFRNSTKKHKESFWKVLDATAPAPRNSLRDRKDSAAFWSETITEFPSSTSLGDAVSERALPRHSRRFIQLRFMKRYHNVCLCS